jgi:outer membrane protein OmpA-like peptidoglycan-associated protein
MFEFFLGMAIGAFLLYQLMAVIATRLIEKSGGNVDRYLDEQLKLSTPELDTTQADVEEIDGIFYLFDSNTSEFIAQGYTLDELKQRAKQCLNTGVLIIGSTDPDVISKLKLQDNQA